MSIEFHVLSEDRPGAELRYACALAEQAALQGRRVYLQTTDPGETQRMDDLLWTYSDRSFLPHEVHAGAPPAHERVMVMLGEAPAPATHRELLINLSGAVPERPEAYERIVEIVPADQQRKHAARDRYRQYRERGCTLESVNV